MQNGSEWDDQPLPDELLALLGSYREALPDPEPSATFMPQLWVGIEARRSFGYSFGRMARGIVAAAAAICLLMSLLFVTAGAKRLTLSSTYVDVLSEDHTEDASEPELAHAESL